MRRKTKIDSLPPAEDLKARLAHFDRMAAEHWARVRLPHLLDPGVPLLGSGRRRRCQRCGRNVMPRNIDLWCAPGLNTDIQPGFYCAHCAYELDQEYADKFEHPCAACGRIVVRAKAGAALLCPECKPTYAPLVRRYHTLAQRGANGVHDLPFSFAEFLAWLADQPQECHWCGVPVGDGYHLDHVMPVSRGGKSTLDNLVISCPTCNSRKHAQLPGEWQRSAAYRAHEGTR